MNKVIGKTEQLLMDCGLYRDVISVVQSYLSIPKKVYDERRKHTDEQLKINIRTRGYQIRPSHLKATYKPFRYALGQLDRKLSEEIYHHFRVPPINEVVKQLDYLTMTRLEYLYKKYKFVTDFIIFSRISSLYGFSQVGTFIRLIECWNKPKNLYFYTIIPSSDKDLKSCIHNGRYLGDRATQEKMHTLMSELRRSLSKSRHSKYIKERNVRVERGEYHTHRLIWEDFGSGQNVQYNHRGTDRVVIGYSNGMVEGKTTYRYRHIKLDIIKETHEFRYYKLHNKDMIFIPFSNSFIPFTRMNKKTKNEIHDNLYRFIHDCLN